ncbi:delta-1-pyrroline-5-carboxylate dehydrogenase [Dethiosulfatibacter aminovorans DSM 17477]|uniref:L-glutamate gamma-semialdehyde dehydrogenase n=1 Tax=Dethiosulfatibacter aminovorans DSM 17477 TaxID=1121476 RepID=A0A1M6JFK2_9FIRM|nr:L-glutamate gamma-semialdehyde dehydrogenase [Dethiosulfatibacter aminovorans]SHJ45424.1 delta-1-pyrroline-5-carboxylate dehydrogenase [Dethiosulfatibacter aminovorans DSM 17477]
MKGNFNMARPVNEKILEYLPGSRERRELGRKLNELKNEVIEIPLIIGGREIRTGNLKDVRIPHNKEHVIARYHMAGEEELMMAVEAAVEAGEKWRNMPWQHRASVFLKAADLLSSSWRQLLNASTMLGQSKTVIQAEIDSACELTDFLRYNAYFMQEIYKDQPESSLKEWNRTEYRPLEGFVLAISPFNFTAIGGNLSSAPAIMGNTVVWKPSGTAIYSNYFVMRLLMEAGMPAGVINFVPSRGSDIEKHVISSEHLAGVHFTGSTKVFNNIWKNVGMNLDRYRNYPRLVGETGGKDFIFAHNSADIKQLATAMVRGAFEYQGQKCSAASRAYIPASIWEALRDRMEYELGKIQIGETEDFDNFMGAVIDRNSYDNIERYIKFAKNSEDAEIIFGGHVDDSVGYFVEPTVVVTDDPEFKLLKEEIFGPVLTIYVYEDENLMETLEICDTTSPYALTGAIFASDRDVIRDMEKALLYSAGNFYINDKPTGAVVGAQPFGGGRKSGTNDKAGSRLNLLRWTSARTIKENYNPPKNILYPYMEEKTPVSVKAEV